MKYKIYLIVDMATLSQDTYIVAGVPLAGLGGGSSSPQTSTFSSIVVRDSTITQTLVSAYISTLIIDAEEAFISSISTFGLYLDGNLLTTATGAGAELLLNGIPIATTQNISSLTDWAFDPAISTVNMNGNPIINSIGYTGTGTISTSNLNATTAAISSLVCDDILTTTLTVQSTIHTISSISSVVVQADALFVSSINGSEYPTSLSSVNTLSISSATISSINGAVFPQVIPELSTFNTASISSATISTINGVVFPQVIDAFSTFDTASISSATISTINGVVFPQVIDAFSTFDTASISSATISTINGVVFPQVIDAFSTFNTASISSATISSINGAVFPQDSVANWANYPPVAAISNAGDISVVSDRGASLTTSAVNINAKNGLSGVINMVADSGYGYNSGGYINLNSKGGSALTGLYGRIDLLAESGSALGVATGGLINITATTGLSLDNATSAVKINAGSVNSYAGPIPVVGSLFGYNFMYGTLGANICAGLPSVIPNVPGTVYVYGTTGIELNSDVYMTKVYPYWSGVTNPADVSINGRTVNVGLGAYNALVNLSTVGTIDFSLDTRSPSRIRYITSIEGSSLTISGVSTINGVEYPPPAGSVDPDLTLSSLTMNSAGTISTNNIAIANATSISVSGRGGLSLNALNGVDITDNTFPGSLDVGAITSVSTINGVEYPPPAGSVDPDLTLSSLTMAATGTISTNTIAIGTGINMSTNGIGGLYLNAANNVYITDGMFPGSLDVGAITSVSSINGVEYPPPAGSITSSIAGGGAIVECDTGGTVVARSVTNGDGQTSILTMSSNSFSLLASLSGSGFEVDSAGETNITSDGVIHLAARDSQINMNSSDSTIALNAGGQISIETVSQGVFIKGGTLLAAPPAVGLLVSDDILYFNGVDVMSGDIPPNLAISSLSIFNSADGNDSITITNPTNQRYSKFTTTNTGTYLFAFSSIGSAVTGSIQMGNTGVVPGEAVVITCEPGNAALIVTNTGVQTSSLTVSSINGQPYIPGGIPPNIGISSLSIYNSPITDNCITITNPTNERFSKFTTTNTGTYLFAYSSIGGLATGSIQMGNTGVVPGEAVIITGNVDNNAAALIISDTGVQTSSLTVSSINGQQYMPGGGIPPDLTLSTLIAAQSISTTELFISSINGQQYIPGGGIPPNLTLSTLLAAQSISTPELFISSIKNASRISIQADAEGVVLTGGALSAGAPALGVCVTDSSLYFNASTVNVGMQSSISKTSGSVYVNASGGVVCYAPADIVQVYGATTAITGVNNIDMMSGGTKISMVNTTSTIAIAASTITMAALALDATPTNYVSFNATSKALSYAAPPIGPTPFVDAFQIYVAPNGNDTTGTGSQQNPYLTIASALTKRATLSVTIEVSIILSSGTYTESFTLLRNTFLIGIPTGEQQQPVNVVGSIAMNTITNQVGISGLQVTGLSTGTLDTVRCLGSGGTYSIYNCNITGTVGNAVNFFEGTAFMTECRVTGASATYPAIDADAGSTVTIRDCTISNPTGNIQSVITSTGTITMHNSIIQSLNTTSTVLQPIITFSSSATAESIEMNYCQIKYANTLTDTGGNKCCIQFTNSNAVVKTMTYCLLSCEGAITGVGGNIQCIQKTGTGTVTMSYGNLLAGATANHIAPAITHVALTTVV